MDFVEEAEKAEKRIKPYIRKTPLEFSYFLSQEGNNNTFLKLENLQLTNSFKLRGAVNKILSLEKNEKDRGVITSSSGNHGAAFAYITNKLGVEGTIYLPEYVSKAKLDALQYYGTKLVIVGNDCVETENHARKIALEKGLSYVSPYNDPKIVAGQATIGIELKDQLKNIDVVLVPIGGGGLISGIAGYLKSVDNNIKIIGCQPSNSAVMYESIKKGEIVIMESLDTISDGTAGGIEENSITFDYCKKYVDDFILVSEEEIKESIKLILKHHYMLVEGAGAVTIASFLKNKDMFEGKNVVLIISGAKISLDKIKEIMC